MLTSLGSLLCSPGLFYLGLWVKLGGLSVNFLEVLAEAVVGQGLPPRALRAAEDTDFGDLRGDGGPGNLAGVLHITAAQVCRRLEKFGKTAR